MAPEIAGVLTFPVDAAAAPPSLPLAACAEVRADAVWEASKDEAFDTAVAGEGRD